MSSRYAYDYYNIELPGEAFDNNEEICNHAINEARERAKLYCLPAEWSAQITSGTAGDYSVLVKVCRKRLRDRNL